MITRTYHVNGMTCGHCVRAVSDELRPLDDAAVRASIDDAGYEMDQ